MLGFLVNKELVAIRDVGDSKVGRVIGSELCNRYRYKFQGIQFEVVEIHPSNTTGFDDTETYSLLVDDLIESVKQEAIKSIRS